MTESHTPLWRREIRHFGFTLSDHFNGPFSLEIDYIKVLRDDAHRHKSPYEYPGATHGMDLGPRTWLV